MACDLISASDLTTPVQSDLIRCGATEIQRLKEFVALMAERLNVLEELNETAGNLVHEVPTVFRYFVESYTSYEPVGAPAGTVTLSFNNGTYAKILLTNDIGHIVFVGNSLPAASRVGQLTLEFTQDGTGGWEVEWPENFYWPNGLRPQISTTPLAITIISLYTADGGETFMCFPIAQNMAPAEMGV